MLCRPSDRIVSGEEQGSTLGAAHSDLALLAPFVANTGKELDP